MISKDFSFSTHFFLPFHSREITLCCVISYAAELWMQLRTLTSPKLYPLNRKLSSLSLKARKSPTHTLRSLKLLTHSCTQYTKDLIL